MLKPSLTPAPERRQPRGVAGTIRALGRWWRASRDETGDERLADRLWELREREARFQALTDALGDLVVHRDAEGRITMANRVLAELCGAPPAALLGRRLEEFGLDLGALPPAALTPYGLRRGGDVRVDTPSGPRWFAWTETPVREDAGVSHRAIARDITARKEAEAALEAARARAEHASQAKSRFLATVSHEIRTPMNGVLGMAALLGATQLSAGQRTYVDAVSQSAASLMTLIEDLLDFSKIEADRFVAEVQPTALRDLADGVVELLAPRAYAKNIGLAAFVAPDVPLLVSTDPGRLRQVLLNLVGNAVKFTERGGVLLSLEREGAGLAVRVADTGPGLAEADRARVFEEFEQGDNTTTRAHGGAGLGLSISRRLADAIGGAIRVEAAPGGGSVFTVTLPLEGAAPEPVPLALAGRRVRLLGLARVDAEAMRRVIEAHGGEAVDDEAPSVSCDTLVTGLGLEDAGAGLRALRSPDGLGARAYAQAVVVIAPDERDRLPRLRAAGYDDFLVRPVRGATLLRALLRRLGAPLHQRPLGSSQGGAFGASGLRVLVAEDNEVNALLVRAALARAGHRVEAVTNGRAAVGLLTGPERERFDLALMDLHMPVLDGLDAIAAVRAHEAATGLLPIPILVVSADGREATRHSALAEGASGFVVKPVDPGALASFVDAQAA